MPKKLENLVGRRFGMLTVIEYDHTDSRGSRYWLCRCDCGNTSIVPTNNLTSGHSSSCGCMSHQYKDISGKRFGRLVAIEPIKTNHENEDLYWRCICDCGNEIITRGV